MATSSWRSRDEAGRGDPRRALRGRACRRPCGSRTGRWRGSPAIWSSSATARQPSAVSRRNGVADAERRAQPDEHRRDAAAGSVAGRIASEPGAGGADGRAGPAARRRRRVGHGPARELREVGLALLQERPRALVRLVGRVVEAGRVAGELLEPGQAVGRDEERRLEEADRGRAHLQDLVRPRDALGLEVGERHDLVDEAHLERLGGRVPAAQEPDLLGLLVAHEARQQPDPEARVERAHLRPDLAEDRVLAGDREVAHDVEDVAAADRVAVDERDDRDRQRADLALEVEHVEAGQRRRRRRSRPWLL